MHHGFDPGNVEAQMSPNPCQKCQMSPRNTVHVNKQQFGYHEWEEGPLEEEVVSLEDRVTELENLVHNLMYGVDENDRT